MESMDQHEMPTVSGDTGDRVSSEYQTLDRATMEWQVAPSKVSIIKVIGKGAFGQVAKAIAVDIRGMPGESVVAVKMLKDPLMVLIEYVPYGDLLGFLRRSRGLNDTYYNDPDVKPQTTLTSQQLMKFAWEIADGMSFLASNNIIHRDLAARNVLVGDNETCKVTDFGMARENDYERKAEGRLPIKWTAYEALLYGHYTTKSDVWSYGIVLYEIFTVGGRPYPQITGREIVAFLRDGKRMARPKHLDDELYHIMQDCWQANPLDRPTFEALKEVIEHMQDARKEHFNWEQYDGHVYQFIEIYC